MLKMITDKEREALVKDVNGNVVAIKIGETILTEEKLKELLSLVA